MHIINGHAHNEHEACAALSSTPPRVGPAESKVKDKDKAKTKATSIDFRYPFCTAMLVTLLGAYADAWYHLTGLAAKEGFFTPAHATIYGGVTVMAICSYVYIKKPGLRFLGFLPGVRLELEIEFVRWPLYLGIALMALGGAWDFTYHSIHGFIDIAAWTPPHLTVTAGFVVLMGSSFVQFWKSSDFKIRSLLLACVALFIALWATVIALSI
jgi:hypothetical protein